eukprot:3069868-Pleurochrysis_carterae.AAC.1
MPVCMVTADDGGIEAQGLYADAFDVPPDVLSPAVPEEPPGTEEAADDPPQLDYGTPTRAGAIA